MRKEELREFYEYTGIISAKSSAYTSFFIDLLALVFLGVCAILRPFFLIGDWFFPRKEMTEEEAFAKRHEKEEKERIAFEIQEQIEKAKQEHEQRYYAWCKKNNKPTVGLKIKGRHK